VEETTTTPATPTGNPTSSTSATPGDEGTPFFETAGGIVLIVFLVLLGVGLLTGIGYWFYRKRRTNSSSV